MGSGELGGGVTVVGCRPARDGSAERPPSALEAILLRAAHDEPYAADLLRRHAAAAAGKPDALEPGEREALGAVPSDVLRRMLDAVARRRREGARAGGATVPG